MPATGGDLARMTRIVALGVTALGLTLAGCAETRNEELEAARATLTNVRSDPEVRQYAPNQLATAEQALVRADAAFDAGAPEAEIQHLAYLVEQRAAIARAAAEEEGSNQEMAALSEERERVLLDVREEDLALAERRARDAQAEAEALRQELAELQAEQTERGLVVTLGDILFRVDSAELAPGGIQRLTRIADFLRTNPERRLLIEGHTDSTGDDAYNRELSQRRANAVEDFLIAQGVDPTRIAATGYGEQFPIAPNETSAGRQQNRRVEIVILDPGEALPPPRAALQ